MSVEIFYTSVDEWNIDKLKEVLIDDEVKQISKIIHLPTVKLKIVSRALARLLLGKYLDVCSKKIIFNVNEYGKLELDHNFHLFFNISHSNVKVLIGITDVSPIGVDLEFVQPLSNEQLIAKKFFSSNEYISYRNCYLNQGSFYRFWTAKEAIIKALGKGIGAAMSVPDVILEENHWLLKGNMPKMANWKLYEMDLERDYKACLAVNCQNINITVGCLREAKYNYGID